MSRTLIIEPDGLAAILARPWTRQGELLHVLTASPCRDARAPLKRQPVDLLVRDFGVTENDGLEILREFREDHPDLPAIIMSELSEVRAHPSLPGCGPLRLFAKSIPIEPCRGRLSPS